MVEAEGFRGVTIGEPKERLSKGRMGLERLEGRIIIWLNKSNEVSL